MVLMGWSLAWRNSSKATESGTKAGGTAGEGAATGALMKTWAAAGVTGVAGMWSSDSPSFLSLRMYFCAWERIWSRVLEPTLDSISFQLRPSSLNASTKRWCSSSVHFSCAFEVVYDLRFLSSSCRWAIKGFVSNSDHTTNIFSSEPAPLFMNDG